MLNLGFDNKSNSTYKVLCLGSHCDDIEIGCGGTILKLVERFKKIIFYWVILSSDKERANEAFESANIFLKNAEAKEIVIKNFRENFFPYVGTEIKEFFNQLKQEFTPDIIFTHYRNDLHQDHRIISELTWNTFRDHFILEYEIPKYDGDLGSPNFFIHLNESLCHRKIKYIQNTFKTQKENYWFTEETFLSILRLRGIESNALGKYAEAFYCRKMVFL